MKSILAILCITTLMANLIFAQAFDQPESAVYDAANDRYLISNTGNGDIISVPRTDPNNLSYFNTGTASSIRGIAIVGNTLWCASTHSNGTSEVLFNFDLNGNYIQEILIGGGNFINDVAAGESGFIYVSDANVNKIYKVNINDGSYSDLNFGGSNGLLYDEANNRLLYTDDTPTTGSQISAIDLATNTSSVLITNTFSALDGLTVDHLGNYYVSCWSSPYSIYRYDSNFTGSILASDHDSNGGAADIFYDTVNNVMVVPNMDANTVQFIPFAQLSAEDNNPSVPSEISLHQNFPNPFNPNTTISYDVNKESNVKITIFDLLGRAIITLVDQIEKAGSRSVNWDGRDFTGNLVNAGVYIYQIEAEGFTKTKKMVLLK